MALCKVQLKKKWRSGEVGEVAEEAEKGDCVTDVTRAILSTAEYAG